MKDPKKYVRQCILALEPYSTARDDFKGGEVSVWLDANESPYNHGTMTGNVDIDVNRYPDPHQKALKAKIAMLKGVPANTIFIGGAGSDEAIDLIYRIFCNPGVDNVIAISPSYGVYSVAADINDVEYRPVALKSDFSLDIDALLSAADAHSKVLWICSPNNPTGNAFCTDDILALCHSFDGIVAVDEAYVDFSTKGSMLKYVGEVRNLIVLQTFSKAWGMASLRLGMAFADPDIAALMASVKYPYNVNGMTQIEVSEQINRDITRQVDEIITQKLWLIDQLGCIDAVEHIYPSDANFILIKVKNADDMYAYLTSKGILVRNRTRVAGCYNCLRITVGTPQENEKLISALKSYR